MCFRCTQLTEDSIDLEKGSGMLKEIEESCRAKMFAGIYVLKLGDDINNMIDYLKRLGFEVRPIHHTENHDAITTKHNAVVISW